MAGILIEETEKRERDDCHSVFSGMHAKESQFEFYMRHFPRREPPIYTECLMIFFRSRIRRPGVMMVQNMPTTLTILIGNFIFLPIKLFYIFACGHGIMLVELVLIIILQGGPAPHVRIQLYWAFNVLCFGTSATSLMVEDVLLSPFCSITNFWGRV